MKSQKLLALAILITAGCGSSDRGEDARLTGQQAFDTGLEQLAAKDFTAAAESFQNAQTGELTTDIYLEACFHQAEALTGLKKFDEALQAIDNAAEGAAMDRVHIAKAVVYRAKGDKSLEKAEFQKARSFNKKAKMPE